MAKVKRHYVCQACGTAHSKWSGQCHDCGSWDTITQEDLSQGIYQGKQRGQVISFESLDGPTHDVPRVSTSSDEFDRVLGGGLVPGSVILISGDPGIGKSTLLLQVMGKLAKQNLPVAYISGEESISQVKLRAERLGVKDTSLSFAATTSVLDILATLTAANPPKIVVIDSIQVMMLESIPSAPGTVTQVRACTHELTRIAKTKGITLILVGHVTKDGQIAGPKLLEHMVDTVVYFEGERGHQFRILRAQKNRFGAASEIGVFDMQEHGLIDVVNPSSLFLSAFPNAVSGTCVFAGIEGTRPILVEVQALVAPTTMATPRREVVGWDTHRLAMVLAVLQTRYGANFVDKEVYLNIAGGLRINEPAADVAVALALLSAARNIPLPKGQVAFGEIGLSGEIRQVSHAEARLKEAVKLGFTSAIIPDHTKCNLSGLKPSPMAHVKQLASCFQNLGE